MTTKTKIIGISAVLAVSITSYALIVRNRKNSSLSNPNRIDGKWTLMDILLDIVTFGGNTKKDKKPIVTKGGVTCKDGEIPCLLNPMKCYSPWSLIPPDPSSCSF